MLGLVNLTSFAASHALLLDTDGAHVLCVGIKASFDLPPSFDLNEGSAPVLSPDQEPVMLSPRHLADDPARSLLREAELTLDHPGTDVIVNAVAHAPGGRAVARLPVSVQVGALKAEAVVSGHRIWQRQGSQVLPGAPEPFTRLPLCPENAFGGGHAAAEGFVCDERNPLGRGFCTDPLALIGQPLPNIEAPGAELTRALPGALPPVAGFAARAGHWLDRRRLAGTYDAAWQRDRMPLWPQDLDRGHFRAAMPALQSATELLGHEPVVLSHLSPSGQMAFRLPRVVPQLRSLIRGEKAFQPVHLRRIILEPERGRLVMLWRGMIRAGRDGRVIERVTIDQRRIERASEVAA